MKIKLKKIVGNLLPRQASKITHEWVHVWNSHLEIFSRLQVIENSGQSLLLRRDISQKTVVGYPEVGTSNSNKLHVNFTREIPDFSKLSSMFFNRGFETTVEPRYFEVPREMEKSSK